MPIAPFGSKEPEQYSEKKMEIKTEMRILDHLVDVQGRTGDQELGMSENKKSDPNERSD